MRNTYIENWQVIKDRFEQWWKRDDWTRPLMRIIAPGKIPAQGKLKDLADPGNPRDLYLDVSRIILGFRNYCESHYFLADAFPSVDINLGPGSMALYLGCEPGFAWDTLWFKEKCESPGEFMGLKYDENNSWWKLHQKMLKEAVELSERDFYVAIPGIVENLDILSSLRGPQNLCFDILDEPDAVMEGVKIIDDLYFKYYDPCYDLLKDDDLSSSYTIFNILGQGRVATLQCDFSALISPEMFRTYVQPSLTKQCRNLNHSVFHLDGPDAIKHVPALMEIRELDALQWTYGAGKPDGGCEDWYPIYDQVHEAGKGLCISLQDGGPSDWAKGAQRLVKRYGAKGLYLLFPCFPDLCQAQEMAELFD